MQLVRAALPGCRHRTVNHVRAARLKSSSFLSDLPGLPELHRPFTIDFTRRVLNAAGQAGAQILGQEIEKSIARAHRGVTTTLT